MSDTHEPVIGILALQGDFEAHKKTLTDGLGAEVVLVRTVADLEKADALALPGGESTTLAKLLARIGLDKAIAARAASGMPMYGTCAGMILMAKHIAERPDQPTLALMDITVARNAFGRQLDSFEADISLSLTDSEPDEVRAVFIRAPYVLETGQGVEVLGRFQDRIVAVRQGRLLATAFHPELTHSTRLHKILLDMAREAKRA